MKTYYSLRFTSIITLILALGAINPLHASPYSDAQNLPSWFQDEEQEAIPQPGGEGPGGWTPVEPDNAPETPKPDAEAQEPVNLQLTSSAFNNGAAIPVKYTHDGADVSPPLSWDNVPAKTKSLVLLMARDDGALHWVAFHIAKTVRSIPEAVPNMPVTNGFAQGINGFKDLNDNTSVVGYSGPRPTIANESNTYTFTLMALDYAPVLLPGTSDRAAVLAATNGHVIGLGNLTGTYKRTIADIKLTSSEFNNGEAIPIQFTCDGDNVSPPLKWENVPEGAKSLVLTVTDNKNKSSWIAFNIEPPPDDKEYYLPENIPNVPITNGLYQGTNDSSVVGYSGPCPEMSGNTQLYTFTLRALNEVLNLTAGTTTKTVLEEKITGLNLVGIGTLTGTYKRATAAIDLHSSAFENGANIPVKYTCNGANVSPPLSWDDKKVPAGTKSLVLLVTNAANSSAAWVAFGIIPPAAELPEAIPNTALVNLSATSQMFQGTNAKQGTTEARIGYSGPCPEPEKDENITYNFTLMALNKVPDNLKLDGTASMTDVLAATQNSILGVGTLTGTYNRATTAMTLTSSAFGNGGDIPVKYTCDGANVSPPLSWSGEPDSTKSFIMLVTSAGKSRWIVFNIGADKNSLSENATGLSQGVNDSGATGYTGPCPNLVTDIEIYSFTIIAVNKTLAVASGASYTDVLSGVTNNIVGSGSMTGKYQRQIATGMTLTSSAFSNGGAIPIKYTCDGANVSPPLSWSGEPDSTKSFIMLVTSAGKSRWIVFNIGADKNSLSENATGLSQGVNDSGTTGYTGPCPDLVTDIETYSFTIIAVNKTLAVASGASYSEVLSGVTNNIVGSGSMTGKYTRQVSTGMTLTSAGIAGGKINVEHTCDGANTSPQLSWGGVPETAKSLVLFATNASGASRWVAFSIPTSISSLPAGVPKGPNTISGIAQGLNELPASLGGPVIGYSGPCPTATGGSDTFSFSLMALNIVPTDLTPGTSTMTEVQNKISGHLVGSASLVGTYSRSTAAMTVTSDAFDNGEAIPVKYTCDGANISPQLSWTGAPSNTKSLLVVVTHLDTSATTAGIKSNWLAFGIMPTTNSLPEAIPNAPITNGFAQGVNDSQMVGYSGPCPTQAGVANTYTFTVMALNNVPNLQAGTAKIADVTTAIDGHVIGSGAMTGTYTRTTAVMTLRSDAFQNGGDIPVKYTCDGADVSPPLNWSGAPTTTRSFVVLMTNSAGGAHWVVFNIGADINSLPEALPNAASANGVSQGLNGLNTIGYTGPCPTSTANVYSFTVIALNEPLSLIPGSSKYEDVLSEFKDRIVGSGSMTGKYKRQITASTLKLTSSAFTEGSPIPPDHTCVGDATGRITSPPLAWTGVPNNVQSLALLVIDTSVTGNKIAQWVVYNLNNLTPSGQLNASIPNVATYNGFNQAANDFGGIGYAAPCPPIGDPAHIYAFTLMALDKVLDQDSATATYTNVAAAIAGHILDMATLTGTAVRPASDNDFSLTSVFADGGSIPQLYTCDGSSLSPPLTWGNVPTGTTSLVLTMTGTGAPDDTGAFDSAACHWAAFNIPDTQTRLTQGQPNAFFTGSFYQTKNYQQVYGYSAPCPERGTTGRYLFNLTALTEAFTDAELDSTKTCADVENEIFKKQDQIVATAALTGKYARTDAQGDRLKLTSSAFTTGNTIPIQYTCDSANKSFPLTWNKVPTTAKSLAIVMTDADADATADEPIAHWIAYDIPISQSALPENMPPLPLVHNTYQGINDFELIGYNGPCPNYDDGTHRYVLEIFALTEKLNTASATMNYSKFLELSQNKIIESATLEGTYKREPAPADFAIESDAFSFGQSIPQVYTCDGSDISPPLKWKNPPANTEAFAMLMTDFNAPVGSNAYWVLYNIPKTILSLAEHVPVGPSPTPPGGTSAQAFNDFDIQGYSGPCPSADGGVHQFVYRLVALNAILTNVTDPTYANIIRAMQSKIIASVELNGTYKRQTGGVGAFKLTSSAFADNGVLPKKYRSSGYGYTKYDVYGPNADDKYDISSNGSVTKDEDIWEDSDNTLIEGHNISPPLHWDNVPDGTASLMLFLKDEGASDANSASYWGGNTHWVIYDIPAELNGLGENVPKLPFTGGFYHGKNDSPWGIPDSPQVNQPQLGGAYTSISEAHAVRKSHYSQAYYNGYWGPFLPHRYVFTLVALKEKLNLNPHIIPTNYDTFYQYLIDKTLGKIIDTAELLHVTIPASAP